MDKILQHNNIVNQWIDNIKNKIHTAQTRAMLKVNAEMLQLYWEIGNSIIDAQQNNSWGAQIVDKLATNIKEQFDDTTGFSVRNLKYMRAFAKEYPDFPIVQVPLAQSENEFMQ